MITFQCNTKLIQDEGGARRPRPLRFIREFEYFFFDTRKWQKSVWHFVKITRQVAKSKDPPSYILQNCPGAILAEP